jgi:hypothetical protein
MSGSTSCGHGPSCESDKFIAAETEKWAKVVKFAGIKAQSRVIEHFLTDNGRDALAQPGVYPRVAEFPDADASKRAAAFAASKVSAVPPTIKFVSLLSVSDLRRTSHVGTPSCVKNQQHALANVGEFRGARPRRRQWLPFDLWHELSL